MDPWTGALGGFLIAGVARIVVAQHCTFFINSLCHTVGRQPYSSSHSARDSAIMAFLTFGEGYHNYHHEFQHDYRNGVKPWQWDPSKWTIWTLSKLGLVEGLRRVPDSRILLAEMREARLTAEKHLAELREHGPGLPSVSAMPCMKWSSGSPPITTNSKRPWRTASSFPRGSARLAERNPRHDARNQPDGGEHSRLKMVPDCGCHRIGSRHPGMLPADPHVLLSGQRGTASTKC